MAALTGSNDQEKLANLCERTYKEQAVWYVVRGVLGPTVQVGLSVRQCEKVDGIDRASDLRYC
jgi:hypothetical protein